MNRNKIILTIAMMLVAVVIALSGQYLLAIGAMVAFEFVIAPQLPQCGVNSFGTASSAMIIQAALALVFTKRPFLKNISLGLRDLDGKVMAQKKGQSVITRLYAMPEVKNFGSAVSSKADTDVSVPLNNFKEIAHTFTAAECSATDRNYLNEVAEPVAVALGNYFVDSVAALWTLANYPTRTGADAVANGATSTKIIKGAGWDYTHLVATGIHLDKAGVPDIKRFYVGNGDVYGSMLNDARIIAALNNPDNAGAIASGRLPRVNNFGIEKYVALPTTGNMVGFAGTPDSTAFAVRPPLDPETLTSAKFPGIFTYVTDPTTGLTVRLDEWIGTDLSVNTRVSWLDGVAVGNQNNGQLITTQ